MNINWQNYDGHSFQRFCNALLSLEISKRVVPFSAEGKDGGIDGSFSGEYDGRSGEWRFQEKFHKTARKTAYNSIKADIIPEIQKLGAEDHFIILTNVAILPQEKKELLQLAEQELKKHHKTHVTFDVWDDAKIHTLYIRHPLLRLWMEDGFSTAQLISYEDYFGRRLTVDIEDPSTLANEFIARESDLDLLSQFIESDHELIAVIAGEAGIGKTRLVIEFFKTRLVKLDEWQSLALNTHRIALDKLAFALSGEKNILILVDDAHTYAPEVIAELRNLTRIPAQRKIKLILTGRRISIDRALELIPTVEDKTVRSISLAKLSLAATKELFQRQPNIAPYRNHIHQLALTSNGRPILIVALLRAIHFHIPIPTIKDQDVLKRYVRDYFNAVIQVTAEHTGVSKLLLERFLQLICLLEPIPTLEKDLGTTLFNHGQISVDAKVFFMRKLVEEGLAAYRYEYAITPDYYSDIILASADEKMVMDALETFPQFVSNMILNLVAADEAYEEGGKDVFGLNKLLNIYIPGIETADMFQMKKILLTISAIVYYKPVFAKQAIELLIKRLNGENARILIDVLTSDIRSISISDNSLYSSIARLLHHLLYRKEYERFVFDTVLEIHRHVPDLGLFKYTYALDSQHFIRGLELDHQHFFITEALKRLEIDRASEVFFIDAFKDFLQLDVRVSSADQFKDGQINITTYYIASNKVTRAFRRKVIDALITIYNSTTSEEVKKRVIHELMDIPREISASTRRKKPYQGQEEIVYILDFIESIADNIPLSANKEILDRLYWIGKWGTQDNIKEKIASLQLLLTPKSLPEKILYLLNNAEIRLDTDYKKQIAYVETEAKKILDQYPAEEIADSLAKVRLAQSGYMEFVGVVNKVLFEQFPIKAMAVYDRLWEIDREYIFSYGSYFLWGLRFGNNQIEFYWNKIHELEAEGGWRSLNVILYVYNNSNELLASQDAETIKRIFHQHQEKPEITFNLLMALAALMRSGYETSQLIVHIFDTCPQRPADNFISLNRELDEGLLKEIVMNHTIRFQLTFEIQRNISVLLEKELITEDELFDYFSKRFQLKQEQVAEREFGYEFLPHHNFNMFGSFDGQRKRKVFIRGLRWYVNAEFSGMINKYARDLLEFLRPTTQLSIELAKDYENEVALVGNPSKLVRITETIEVFESKNSLLIELVVKILRRGIALSGTDLQKLKSEAYQAITSVGVKSGPVGEPFPVDLELRQLMVEAIDKFQQDEFVNDFLNKVKLSLEEQIKKSNDRNDTVW